MTATRTIRPGHEFDLLGPLPTGVTVLEASAGTGKTYTIAALAARYVAEGMPLERMLLITFTRMATGELRDRVRERLVTCEDQLSRGILLGAPDPGADEIVALLATGSPDQVSQRRDRLVRAIANFDAATIATTHGFCQEMLAELGTIGDLEPGTEFVEDVSELLEEVLDDLYVRRFQKRGGAPFDRQQALKIARAAVFNPTDVLEPQHAPRESAEAMRYRLAVAVREELERRKRQLAIMTYDDLLTRLNQTLRGASGAAAVARLRARYRVVLVDEFQDTDPVQWQILHRAFVGGGVTLVLIADPKQAIYAFRGADVYAYLVAANTSETKATLQLNRRSDQPLLDAYDALFGNARLGHPGIVYRRATATDAHQAPRLVRAPDRAPLRVRVVHRDEPTIERTRTGLPQAPSTREHIARDLAAEVVALLSSDAQIEQRSFDGTVTGCEPICAGDIAVLVRTHVQADLVRGALEAERVPAVINGAGSVFATPSARDWLRLLEAIDRPATPSLARSATLTPFIGWGAEQVATAGEQEWDEVHRRLHRWNRVLRERGVAELTETIMLDENLPARVLAIREGERQLTDLRHLGQLLHRAAATERLGPTALRGWLAQQIAATEQEEGEEERTRRLESDAQAVQILTIHRSKGLEFSIVMCPFLWAPGWSPRDPEPVFFHDAALGDRRTIDVGLEGRSYRAHQQQHHIEERGEDLRLLYVALTRAKHQAVLWWASAWDSQHSPLGRLLFARDEEGTVAPDGGTEIPGEAAVVARLEQLSADAPGCISVTRSTLTQASDWMPPAAAGEQLAAARFERRLDRRWRRTSYSDITFASHDPLVGSEPEDPTLTDEPQTPALTLPQPPSSPELESPSLLAEMPVGVKFGTFAHRVIEATDFAADDLDAALVSAIELVRQRRRLELGDDAAAVAGFRAALETPLGERVARNIRLRDVARCERLDELGFELPLVGGDDPSGRLTLEAIAEVLREHLSEEDPMAAYATRLEDPALRASVRGFLTGSIDLVLRLAGQRFAIIDYKTNWLGPAGEPLTLAHYRPESLAAEMSRAHYGLQAMLYTVALHRYLRWRLRGYEVERHLAGVLYLFLRGMAGAENPVLEGSPCGVFSWSPPGRLVSALSDVLDRGAPA
ncbi:MAG: UvrD-helicase domain-containing protein [Solirubrobacterales bacterium]|nr:UvrD-helicase domain-containing protein [Solirubrobacterales bacterium]